MNLAKEHSARIAAQQADAMARQVGGDHYKHFAIQPIEFIDANNIPFIEANIIKYICRHDKKGGKADLDKVRHYVDLLEQLRYSEQ